MLSTVGAFDDELRGALPDDLPHREVVISKAARHLEFIEETNRQFNLTRITSAREATIKHIVDSVLPWRHFAGAKGILDAGTGAGFPGLPLAMVLPESRFTLAESTGKKARFVQGVVEKLGLSNVVVVDMRAEDWLRSNRADLLTGRALAPLNRACEFFASAIRGGARALLYKGPDAETEIAEAAAAARKFKLRLRVVARYELPDSLGTRALVEMTALT